MLLEWNALDPVSPKETARNNAVYLIQGNRNPYIDNPEWAIAVWAPESLTVKELDARFNIWYSKSN